LTDERISTWLAFHKSTGKVISASTVKFIAKFSKNGKLNTSAKMKGFFSMPKQISDLFLKP
jgi:hypothetical protein